MKKILPFVPLMSMVFSSCKKEEEVVQEPERHVEYKIGCTDCEVIYNNSQGQSVTEYNQNNNWSYSFDGKAGDVVLLFAYNTSSVPQGVTASILLNGSTLQEQTNYCPISGYSFVVDTLEYSLQSVMIVIPSSCSPLITLTIVA